MLLSLLPTIKFVVLACIRVLMRPTSLAESLMRMLSGVRRGDAVGKVCSQDTYPTSGYIVCSNRLL